MLVGPASVLAVVGLFSSAGLNVLSKRDSVIRQLQPGLSVDAIGGLLSQLAAFLCLNAESVNVPFEHTIGTNDNGAATTSYLGGSRPGELTHSFRCKAVSACRALRIK